MRCSYNIFFEAFSSKKFCCHSECRENWASDKVTFTIQILEFWFPLVFFVFCEFIYATRCKHVRVFITVYTFWAWYRNFGTGLVLDQPCSDQTIMLKMRLSSYMLWHNNDTSSFCWCVNCFFFNFFFSKASKSKVVRALIQEWSVPKSSRTRIKLCWKKWLKKLLSDHGALKHPIFSLH